MILMNLREIMSSGLKEMNLAATTEQLKLFEQFTDLMLDWNEKVNLTAILEPEEIVTKHYLDSLVPLLYQEKYKLDFSSILDMGTGGGFPGMPLKILLPEIKVILADSLNKRIAYLNHVIEELGLQNIQAVHGRAEDLGQDPGYRERFSIVFSRAVARLNVLAEYCLPLVQVGGHFVALKGPDLEEELAEGKAAIKALGGKTEGVEVLELPLSHDPRTLVIVKKLESTAKKYPRRAGLPAKKPIE